MSASTEPPPSLAGAYAQCVRSFDAFVEALRQPDCLVEELVRIADIVDEHGRVLIWGDQTKAWLVPSERGSLDDTLRRNTDLRGEVLGILQRLQAVLEQAAAIARRKAIPRLESGQQSVTSDSSDPDYTTDEDSEAEQAEQSIGESRPAEPRSPPDSRPRRDHGSRPRRKARICGLVQQMQSQIRLLFDVSAVLRQPAVADQYLRSVRYHQSPLPVPPNDLLLEGSVLIRGMRLIESKVWGWRKEHSLRARNPWRSGAPYGSQDAAWFFRRLAEANLLRRYQLQYWKTHLYGTAVERATEPAPKPERMAIHKDHSEAPAYRGRVISTSLPENRNRGSAVPDPPQTDDGAASFTCPYCARFFAKTALNVKHWRRHVLYHLRPYVCTFEDCGNGTGIKLFASRENWINHESLVHRRRFVCNQAGCSHVYGTRAEIKAHLLQDHDGGRQGVPPELLGAIVDLCDRPIDASSPIQGQECLLCLQPFELVDGLQEHLAEHMEEIALSVLLDDDAPQYDSGAPVQAAAKGKAVEHRRRPPPFRHAQAPADISSIYDSGNERSDLSLSKHLALSERDSFLHTQGVELPEATRGGYGRGRLGKGYTLEDTDFEEE